MKFLITGAAGFIGSNLTDRLLSEGHEVTGVDNFSTGRHQFLEIAKKNPHFSIYERDLLDPSALLDLLSDKVERVFHFAANADVRNGLEDPRRDLEQNTIVTSNVLEAIRKTGVKKLTFSSTGSVYGEAEVIPTPEDCPFPTQTSLYGASKLACEGLIAAYAQGYGIQAEVFRFVSILGERYTHGHIFDFLDRLQKNPNELTVLGNGTQRKSYLYVQDCIDAILLANRTIQSSVFTIFNLGNREFISVKDSIEIITKELGCNPKLIFGTEGRGWIGDNPFILLECAKIRKLGWLPKASIQDGVKKTVGYLRESQWLFKEKIR